MGGGGAVGLLCSAVSSGACKHPASQLPLRREEEMLPAWPPKCYVDGLAAGWRMQRMTKCQAVLTIPELVPSLESLWLHSGKKQPSPGPRQEPGAHPVTRAELPWDSFCWFPFPPAGPLPPGSSSGPADYLTSETAWETGRTPQPPPQSRPRFPGYPSSCRWVGGGDIRPGAQLWAPRLPDPLGTALAAAKSTAGKVIFVFSQLGPCLASS